MRALEGAPKTPAGRAAARGRVRLAAGVRARARPLVAVLLALLVPPAAAERVMTLASTTSTQASGLFEHLLPAFERASGVGVRVVAVGTGQALAIGERGDADALLVHDRDGELAFLAAGHGSERREVMYNDFVLVGPPGDPAGVAGMSEASAALARVGARGALFLSRGDDSGTHRTELRLWRAAGLEPAKFAPAYREAGAGMGQTLNMAAELQAYTLSDRASWLAFPRRAELPVLVEGDERLRNQYALLLVDPARHPHVRAAEARALADWLVSPEGQAAIAAFRLGGQAPFVPNAAPGAAP